jgi:His-Xaa-Ser system radical SAM maturase HxsC
MSMPLHLRCTNANLPSGLYKVLGIEEALLQQFRSESVLVDIRSGPEVELASLAAFGFAGIVVDDAIDDCPLPHIHSLSIDVAVAQGDAARVLADGRINVLYRRGANANTLFVTERCNSLCLMCSQPPREIDDRWRVAELVQLLPLIDPELAVLGVTGGEPTLLESDLVILLAKARKCLPLTRLHVLSNGRKFADRTFADMFDELRGHVIWAVPLYADIARIHDYIVQSDGAFTETMNGLHNLAERGHRIELRTVLHAQTLPRIERLAQYIYRNLPFVEHVALMGLEPMGLSRSNMPLLEINPAELSPRIAPAMSFLHQSGMQVSAYNIPLCALEPALRPFARKSISDWKNEYANACSSCSVKEDCCGFFRSTATKWRDGIAAPILEYAA